ncbi:MAG: hypothetical protein IKD68_12140 [Solobacterium sp.]|nr:hypothetical protein [Solobacterium sp.]
MGWQILPSGGREIMMPDGELQRISSEVLKDYQGKNLKPVALIGKQTVSGMNYRLLTRCDNADGTSADLYVTTLFVSSDKVPEVSENRLFDLAAYADSSVKEEAGTQETAEGQPAGEGTEATN